MALKFRNIDGSTDDPVQDWGVTGMVSVLVRGDLPELKKLAQAVAEDPGLEPLLDTAIECSEVPEPGAYVKLVVARLRRTPKEKALIRFRQRFEQTGMSQGEVAEVLGTSRTRFNTYLSGKVTPSMDVLVALEDLALARTAHWRFDTGARVHPVDRWI